MGDRTFVVQRFDVVDGPAEPGYGWGTHAKCDEVRLTLGQDERFRLQLGAYYSDWGDWRQDLVIYEGSYADTEGGIVCWAVTRSTDSFFHDHETDQTSKRRDTTACQERFDFSKRGEGVVVCPVDHAGLAGVVMTTQVMPMRDFRKR